MQQRPLEPNGIGTPPCPKQIQLPALVQLPGTMGMARNRVQFQKGLLEAGFVGLYGTEELCRKALAQ